jgi:hypothetical protein
MTPEIAELLEMTAWSRKFLNAAEKYLEQML